MYLLWLTVVALYVHTSECESQCHECVSIESTGGDPIPDRLIRHLRRWEKLPVDLDNCLRTPTSEYNRTCPNDACFSAVAEVNMKNIGTGDPDDSIYSFNGREVADLTEIVGLHTVRIAIRGCAVESIGRYVGGVYRRPSRTPTTYNKLAIDVDRGLRRRSSLTMNQLRDLAFKPDQRNDSDVMHSESKCITAKEMNILGMSAKGQVCACLGNLCNTHTLQGPPVADAELVPNLDPDAYDSSCPSGRGTCTVVSVNESHQKPLGFCRCRYERAFHQRKPFAVHNCVQFVTSGNADVRSLKLDKAFAVPYTSNCMNQPDAPVVHCTSMAAAVHVNLNFEHFPQTDLFDADLRHHEFFANLSSIKDIGEINMTARMCLTKDHTRTEFDHYRRALRSLDIPILPTMPNSCVSIDTDEILGVKGKIRYCACNQENCNTQTYDDAMRQQ